jgi:tetratricopeptide (TPR) repeat protein
VKNNIIVILSFLTMSCSSLSSLYSKQMITTIDYPLELKEAQYFLRNNNGERAESEVQKYLGTTKDVYWQGQAYLMLGEIRESVGQENLAIEAYKQAVKHGAGYNSAIAAQALYRMSWIYERTLQYNDLQITLMDLMNVLGSGDNFIKHIETPARLANTYYVLSKWDQAIAQRDAITPVIFERYKSLAKDESNLFQARLYMAFQGMKPISITPYKSQQIITNCRQELLEVAEMGTPQLAQRAVQVLESEYQRYFSQLKKISPASTPVEMQVKNQQQIKELATFVDEINELRILRRPPELVVNKQLNVDFFRSLEILEHEARQIVHNLAYGIQKAQSKKNINEKPTPRRLKQNSVPENKTL